MKKILIVGAGLSGSVIARELAEFGNKITIIDKRIHIAGNTFDYINEHGIRIHKYGPHLFHTNNEKVFKWLSRFTNWIPYKHKVKAILNDGNLVTLPINAETRKIVGDENLIETFIRPYSEKMWGMKLEELDPQIINRVPMRDDDNEFYFPNDKFQYMPENGYTELINNILNHDNIEIKLNTSFEKNIESKYDHIFNSMPIDEYFDFCFGELPYRSIKFHNTNLPVSRLFPVSVVNFTNNSKFTRIVEWKNIPNSEWNNEYTTVTHEEPCDYKENNNERYYPVKDIYGKNREIYNKYQNLVPKKITFIGRLGLYSYLDMDQCVNSALTIANNFSYKI